MRDETGAAEDLLTWYDRHARSLPWRVPPADRQAGVAPDPYAVWLSEIMLQQTTVVAVRPYFSRFLSLWPRVTDLAEARDEDVMAEWAGLGYYARARNLLKCARVVARDHGGRFPTEEAALLSLPGIGPYTAAAIAAIAFDRPATVVDGNVERVMARAFAVEEPLPGSKAELKRLAARLTPQERPGDYAQAVMDLGATVCTPKSPACGICPWVARCTGRATGRAADLPAKTPKAAKPVRHGFVYLARRTDGAWLLETRPESGLLGGMLGWPSSDWSDSPTEDPPCPGDWRSAGVEVRHTFTHFHLRLAIRTAVVPQGTMATRGTFRDLRPDALPTLMRKAWDLSRDSFAAIEPGAPLA